MGEVCLPALRLTSQKRLKTPSDGPGPDVPQSSNGAERSMLTRELSRSTWHGSSSLSLRDFSKKVVASRGSAETLLLLWDGLVQNITM